MQLSDRVDMRGCDVSGSSTGLEPLDKLLQKFLQASVVYLLCRCVVAFCCAGARAMC